MGVHCERVGDAAAGLGGRSSLTIHFHDFELAAYLADCQPLLEFDSRVGPVIVGPAGPRGVLRPARLLGRGQVF